MVRCRVVGVLSMLGMVAVVISGCGSKPDADGLEKFAGWYDLTETFSHDQGTQCPAVPTEIFENSVDMRVDGNKLEARFSARWDVLKGEIREDGSFLTTGNMGPDKSIRFSGDFNQESLAGLLDDVSAGECTRTYDLKGTRRVEQQ